MASPAKSDNPADALEAAINANDAALAARVLERHPELTSRLNDPLPNGAFGAVPLIAAVQSGNREMIDLLLRAGADINARSHWWAGSFGVLDDDRGLATFLISRGAVVDVHAAARLGMSDTLRTLVEGNPDLVHARGGDGQLPLHCVRSVDDARYLLDHGADIDARDIDHESTPAQYMVRDHQDVVRELVARGCRTDILMASALGDRGLVLAHLAADPACIRMSVSDRYFPRQNARSGGTIYIWTLGQHKTPHFVAREFGHEDVFQLLMDHSPDEVKLTQACELGDEATVNALLVTRPELVQALSDDDRQKLGAAAQNNNTAAVRVMLGAGWPVDARGPLGGSALHWASWHGNAEMVRDLLRVDAALEIKDATYGLAPIGWALHGSMHGWHRTTGDYAATVEALIQAGASVPRLRDDLDVSEAVRAVLRRT